MADSELPLRIQYAAALIERSDDRVLIARLAAEKAEEESEERRWVFPRGRVLEGETPEVALRRVAQAQLGIKVEIVVGQPPILAQIDAQEVEVRYFFCGITEGKPEPGPYEEIRFTTRMHLAEYELDPASAPVAEWLQADR